MPSKIVLVTGANGQLGWELQQFVAKNPDLPFHFLFADRHMLDLSQPEKFATLFNYKHPAYLINCGAYTAVDKAETDRDNAYQINATVVGVLAKMCAEINCKFIHFSTDYVFDGNGESPYKTDSSTDPVNYYGFTKCEGEKLTLENNPDSIIIRTSWVYSTHGKNFVKSMIRLMQEKEQLNVVGDQTGSPTYAADLAEMVIAIMMADLAGNRQKGIYHYSNSGIISWYQFAEAIKQAIKSTCNISPISTSQYPTQAKRPMYSALDCTKTCADFNIQLKPWQESLISCISKLS